MLTTLVAKNVCDNHDIAASWAWSDGHVYYWARLIGRIRHLQILMAETIKIRKFRSSPPDSWPVCFTLGLSDIYGGT